MQYTEMVYIFHKFLQQFYQVVDFQSWTSHIPKEIGTSKIFDN